MAKKILALTLALAMLWGTAAPAAAAYNVFVGNFHFVGNHQRARTANAESGWENVSNTGGNVDIANDDAEADAGGIDLVNSDVTDVGGPATTSYNVAVVNAGAVGNTQTATGSTAYTGGDTVTNTGGNVDLDNGTTTANSHGWSLTNTSITRVR